METDSRHGEGHNHGKQGGCCEGEGSSETISIDRNTLVLFALAGLFIVGAFQTMQLAGAISQVDALKAGGAQFAAAGAAQGGSPAVQGGSAGAQAGSSGGSALNALPTQVGGC